MIMFFDDRSTINIINDFLSTFMVYIHKKNENGKWRKIKLNCLKKKIPKTITEKIPMATNNGGTILFRFL